MAAYHFFNLRYNWLLLILFSLAMIRCSNRQETKDSSAINSVQEIIDDMAKCHDALPHGVPKKYGWQKCPRTAMGNNPGDFTAMIPWGQVYVSEEGNPATNTRVQLKNLETYYLSKSDEEWRLWNGSYKVDGAAYVENFVDDISKPADERIEPDGSVSIRTDEGFNYHFWSSQGRSEIAPDDIKGVFSTCQARLILHDENLPDDRGMANYMLSVGADYWKNDSIGWDQFKTNGDIAIGRFKFINSEWQAFNMHTLTVKELRENPPPLK